MDSLVGNTPLLRVSFPDVSASVRLLAKLEMFNPMSSVKDRAVLYMLRDAQRTGRLTAGGTVVEATSGNTGIALAAMSVAHGYRCVLVLPDNSTTERLTLLRALGAEVELVPHDGGIAVAIARAEEVARGIPGSWLVAQERNPANIAAHYETTGPEIWAACDGEVDVLICGVGTGGTLTGVSRYLKERRDVHVVAVEPAGSPMMSQGWSGPHSITGIGGGTVQPNTDLSHIDEILAVSDVDAMATMRELPRLAGLFVGVSSAAAMHAGRVVAARDCCAGATIVSILPDSGERYVSILTASTDHLNSRVDNEQERAA